jgi:hypothetical protein
MGGKELSRIFYKGQATESTVASYRLMTHMEPSIGFHDRDRGKSFQKDLEAGPARGGGGNEPIQEV